ncbi:hypothetical protein C2845_PM04G10240 [Panicum miliaceum]|uniref:Uncharacterized protein n=1 Tax=Panicum miliaceum TaxID=4540 RepID=A0A3L6QXZ4_PANMI|nr:hypothetical protein C2845_PM04G10240 [Panicum miliaceum]
MIIRSTKVQNKLDAAIAWCTSTERTVMWGLKSSSRSSTLQRRERLHMKSSRRRGHCYVQPLRSSPASAPKSSLIHAENVASVRSMTECVCIFYLEDLNILFVLLDKWMGMCMFCMEDLRLQQQEADTAVKGVGVRHC